MGVPGVKRVLRNGRIIHADGDKGVDCTILDISGEGARLTVPSSASLPPAFTLLDVLRERRYAVQIEWRRGKSIGIGCCDLAAGSGPNGPIAARRSGHILSG
jgi:hypothetical protein